MARKRTDGDWGRLGTYVVNRRVAIGFRERATFAEAVGLTAQTIGVLENGGRVGASTLAAVENGLGWGPGSTTAILGGGEPEPSGEGFGFVGGTPNTPTIDPYPPGIELRDDNERALWALDTFSEGDREAMILTYRLRQEMAQTRRAG